MSPKCYYKNAVSIDTLSEPYMCLLYVHPHMAIASLPVVLKHLQKLKNKPIYLPQEWEGSMKSVH